MSDWRFFFLIALVAWVGLCAQVTTNSAKREIIAACAPTKGSE